MAPAPAVAARNRSPTAGQWALGHHRQRQRGVAKVLKLRSAAECRDQQARHTAEEKRPALCRRRQRWRANASGRVAIAAAFQPRSEQSGARPPGGNEMPARQRARQPPASSGRLNSFTDTARSQ